MSLPTDKIIGPAVLLHQKETQPEPKKKTTLATFFKRKGPSVSQSGADKIETELAATYLLSPDIDPDIDPFQWGKHHKANIARLSNLVTKYCSSPPIIAP